MIHGAMGTAGGVHAFRRTTIRLGPVAFSNAGSPPALRVGSGAVGSVKHGSGQGRVTREMRGPSGLGQQKLFNSEGQFAVPLNSVWLSSAVFVLTLGSLLTVVGCMMPHHQQQSGDNFNCRIPPRWNPEQDQQYSFRAYTTDLMLWTLLTDLQSHQQAAAVVMRLGGSARDRLLS